MRRFLSVALIVASLAAPALAGPFEYGEDAFARGDYRTAIAAFAPLAEAGDVRALEHLAHMNLHGEGVPANAAAAMRWSLAAVAAGSVPAMTLIGRLYETGAGVPVDATDAATWYRGAADLGDREALLRLGDLLVVQGAPASDALTPIMQAAATGLPEAQHRLGEIYTHGRLGQPKDLVLAAEWYRRAAEQGYAPAQRQLARAYFYGDGVFVDRVLAVMWDELAISNMCLSPLTNLATWIVGISPGEIAAALRLAEDWRQLHPTAPDHPHVEHGSSHKVCARPYEPSMGQKLPTGGV